MITKCIIAPEPEPIYLVCQKHNGKISIGKKARYRKIDLEVCEKTCLIKEKCKSYREHKGVNNG